MSVSENIAPENGFFESYRLQVGVENEIAETNDVNVVMQQAMKMRSITKAYKEEASAGSKYLMFDSVDNDSTWKDVRLRATVETEEIYLGHDGVIEGEEEDIRAVLALPNIKLIYYCAYYTQYNTSIFEDFPHIKTISIY